MSREDAELARRAILATNDGGPEAVLAFMAPDVEFHPPRESMEPGVRHGHAGVRDYFDRLGEIFEERAVESVEVIEVDDSRVLAIARLKGKSSKFGEIETDWAWLITVRDGRATHVFSFVERREALRAAGLAG